MKPDRPSATAIHVLRARIWRMLTGASDARTREDHRAFEMFRLLRPREAPMLQWLAGSRTARALAGWFEKALFPGLLQHLEQRRRTIDASVRRCLAAGGVGQAVNAGAGFDVSFDGLAGEFPSISFIELDHPATQKAKLAALARGSVQSRVTRLPVDWEDLSRDGNGLVPAGDGLTNVIVAEGLTTYLTPAAVSGLFRSLAQVCPPGSVLMFTFVERIDLPGTALARAWLRWHREPFRWACRHAELGKWLAETGWDLEHVTSVDGSSVPEWLGLARRR